MANGIYGAAMNVAIAGATANAASNPIPVTVTGSSGTPATVTANQGTPAIIANRWPVQITDGTNTVPVISSTRGNFLSVGEGAVTAGVSLNALQAAGPGVVIDFGSASSSVTFQVSGTASITAGAVQFMGSVDNITYIPLGTPTLAGGGTAANPLTVAASGNYLMSYTGIAIRYLRCDISTTFTGGTVTAKIMAF